jgi:hypothetical protein
VELLQKAPASLAHVVSSELRHSLGVPGAAGFQHHTVFAVNSVDVAYKG